MLYYVSYGQLGRAIVCELDSPGYEHAHFLGLLNKMFEPLHSVKRRFVG